MVNQPNAINNYSIINIHFSIIKAIVMVHYKIGEINHHLSSMILTFKYCSFELQLKWVKNILCICIVVVLFLSSGCEKFTTVEPPATNPVSTSVYANNSTASAVLTGLYSTMMTNNLGFTSGQNSISILTGLSSDELINYSVTTQLFAQAYTNNLLSTNATFWNELYKYIYVCNAAIEGVSNSNLITLDVKRQLQGEAKFLRAFYYFYLVNLFGEVPLLLATDYRENSFAAKSNMQTVYQQILSDLTDAENLLNENYIGADVISKTTERIRPNKSTASALLARVYLYMGMWQKSEEEATKVINSTLYSLLPDLNAVFLKNSNEAIWQLQPVISGYNTLDGNILMLWAVDLLRTPPPASNLNPFTMSDTLKNSFEINDKRFLSWVKNTSLNNKVYYYPFKYKVRAGSVGAPVTEYQMLFRLAEQYLIRAEARTQQNNLNGAIADLDVIRKRAGLSLIANINPGISQQALIATILHERQVELFTEWGHRWFDLKRSNIADSVMTGIAKLKGGSWSHYKQWYPIPQTDININLNLEQINGY